MGCRRLVRAAEPSRRESNPVYDEGIRPPITGTVTDYRQRGRRAGRALARARSLSRRTTKDTPETVPRRPPLFLAAPYSQPMTCARCRKPFTLEHDPEPSV